MMLANPSLQSVSSLKKVTPTATSADLTRKESVHVRLIQVKYIFIVLTNWTPHQQTFKKQTDKDFKELNRLAIKNNATTSDQ